MCSEKCAIDKSVHIDLNGVCVCVCKSAVDVGCDIWTFVGN